jgi:hypothetical protein
MTVLDTPVTMTLDRDGQCESELVARTFAVLEPLLRPDFACFRSDGDEDDWYLTTEAPDEPDPRHRVRDRVDAEGILELLRDGRASTEATQWSLSWSGPPPENDDDEEREVWLQQRADRLRLDVRSCDPAWAEPASAQRVRVEAIAQSLAQLGWHRIELDGWSHVTDTPNGARVIDDIEMIPFHRRSNTAFDPLERTMQFVDAIAAMAPFFRPRVFSIHTKFVDGEGEPATSIWLLNESVSVTMNAGTLMERPVATIDREAMRSLARDALAPARASGLFAWIKKRRPVTWTYVEASDARVRIPSSVSASTHGESLRLLTSTREHQAPIVREGSTCWAIEPEVDDDDILEPMTMTFDADGDLTIHVHWSLWAHPGSPGRKDLERTLVELDRLGWQRGYDDD